MKLDIIEDMDNLIADKRERAAGARMTARGAMLCCLQPRAGMLACVVREGELE